MIKFYSFILGNISGIYLAQNYEIPKLKNIFDKCIKYMESIEKK